MSIATELSLGSDHKLVTFSFLHNFDEPPNNIDQQHPRKLWNIKRFKNYIHPITDNDNYADILEDIEPVIRDAGRSFEEMVDHIMSQELESTSLEQENKYVYYYRNKISHNFRNIVQHLYDDVNSSIDEVNEEIRSSIYSALDFSVDEQAPRKKSWKWFWNEYLEMGVKKKEYTLQQNTTVPQ